MLRLLPDNALLDGEPSSKRDMARLVAPAIIAYLMIVVFAAVRGNAIISVDDHMRLLLSQQLGDPDRPIVDENWMDDMYYWPWGHLALIRSAIILLGGFMSDATAGVLPQSLCGVGVIAIVGILTRQCGGGSRAIATTSFLTATMPWTLKLGVSILSDLPGALAIGLAVVLHLRALADPTRPRVGRVVLGGDLCLAVAMSMRYEAWILGGVAFVWTTALLARRGMPALRLGGLCVVRLLVLASFPLFWMVIQAARFEGDFLYFRTIAASRPLERFSFFRELVMNIGFTLSSSPAAWILAFVAGLALVCTRRERDLRTAFASGWALPSVLAGVGFLFLVYANVSAGHPANLPDRLVYTPMILMLPVIARLCEIAWDSLGARGFERVWSVAIVCAALYGVTQVAMLKPYREEMPEALVSYIERVGKKRGYGKDDNVSFVVSWDHYPDHYSGLTGLRRYDLRYVPYDEKFAWRSGMYDLMGNTRFALTTNRFYVNGLWEKFPNAPVYQEGPFWFMIDLTGDIDRELEAKLLKNPRIYLERPAR